MSVIVINPLLIMQLFISRELKLNILGQTIFFFSISYLKTLHYYTRKHTESITITDSRCFNIPCLFKVEKV